MSNSVELANSNSTNTTNHTNNPSNTSNTSNNSNNDEIISQLRTYTNADIPLFSLDQQNKICKVVDVYDADTCKIIFQLDGKIVKYNCRLYGIDTPEIRPRRNNPNRDAEKKAAIKARNRLISIISNVEIDIEKKYSKRQIKKLLESNNKIIISKCKTFDKYGRLLVELYLCNEEYQCESISVNQMLINENYAKAYFGGTKTKFIPKKNTAN